MDAGPHDAGVDAGPRDAGGCGESFVTFTYQFPGYEPQSRCMPAIVTVSYYYYMEPSTRRCTIGAYSAGLLDRPSAPPDVTACDVVIVLPGDALPMGYNRAALQVPAGGPCVPVRGAACFYGIGIGVPECQIRIDHEPRRLGDRLDGVLEAPCELYLTTDFDSPDRPTITALEIHGVATSLNTSLPSGERSPVDCPLD